MRCGCGDWISLTISWVMASSNCESSKIIGETYYNSCTKKSHKNTEIIYSITRPLVLPKQILMAQHFESINSQAKKLLHKKIKWLHMLHLLHHLLPFPQDFTPLVSSFVERVVSVASGYLSMWCRWFPHVSIEQSPGFAWISWRWCFKRWGSNSYLVGGFNQFEKYEKNWIIPPGRDENKKMFETTR